MNNDLLKIIVDAELKNNTSLESTMNNIIEKYKTIEVEVKLKGGNGNNTGGFDDKLVKKLEENIKALQAQVDKLTSEAGKAGKSLSEGVSQASKNAQQLNSDMNNILKTSEKINAENSKTNKVVTGDTSGFKTKTVTEKDGNFVSEEIVKNYQKVINQLEKMKNAKNNLLSDKDFKQVNDLIYGNGKMSSLQGLKTDSGQENRYNKILEIFKQLEKENDKLIQQEKDKAKEASRVQANQTRLDNKMPFVDKRLNNVSNFVDDNKNDYINTAQFEKVKQLFEQIDINAKDFKVQLKMAEDELKSLEKHAQGLSNLQDAQNSVRKQMNLDIKKDRNNENADYMQGRGTVPQGMIDQFKQMSNSLNMESTKKDIEEVNKKWRELQQIERDLNKEKKDGEKADKQAVNDVQQRMNAVNALNKKMEELNYKTSDAMGGNKIDTEQYNKLQAELVKVNEEIQKIENSDGKLNEEQRRNVEQQITDIKRLLAEYKNVEAEKQRANRVNNNEGVVDNKATRLTNNFDFSQLQQGDVEGNQRNIQEQIARLTQELHQEENEFARVRESMVQVSRQANTLGQEIYRINYAVSDGNGGLQRYSMTLNASANQVRNLGERMNQTGHEMSTMERLSQAFSRVPIWATATSAVYGFVNFAKEGFQSILKFDSAMIDLKKVANESRDEIQAYTSDAYALANALGVTADQVVQSTTDFARLGFTLQESKGLAQTALTYANVGDMTTDEASTALLSTLKGFNVSAKDAVATSKQYADMFNEVGNRFAISSKGIGEALQRSSAILHQSGNSIQQSIALITSANATIQDPEQVGTALKTISMRLRGISEDGSNVADVIPKLQKYFAMFGSSVMKDNDTFKSTYEIMDELSKHWSKLTDVQQAQITQVIGGERQGSIVSSMIQNWSDATKSYETALNSAGSAQREFNKYMDSYEYKIGKLKGANEEFWNTFFDSDSVKNAIDGLTGLLKMLTNISNSFAFMPMLTALMVGFTTMMSSKVRGLVLFREGIMSMGEAFTLAGQGITIAGKALLNFTKFTLPLMVLSIAIEAVVSAIMKANRAREESLQRMRDEYSQNQQLIASYKQLSDDGTMARYDQLTKMSPKDMNMDERKELLSIQEKMKGVMPDVIDYYDQEGNAVYKSAKAIEELVKVKEKEQAQKGVQLANREIQDFDYSGVKDAVKNINSALVDSTYSHSQVKEKSIVDDYFKNELSKLPSGSLKMAQAIEEMKKKIKKDLGSQAEMNFSQFDANDFLGILNSTGKTKAEIKKAYKEYSDSIKSGSKETSSAVEDGRAELADKTSKIQDQMGALADAFASKNKIKQNSNDYKFIQDFANSYTKGLEKVKADGSSFITYLSSFDNNVASVMKDMSKNKIDVSKLFEGGGDANQITALEELAKSYGKNSTKAVVLRDIIKQLIQEHNAEKDAVDNTSKSYELSQGDMNNLTNTYKDAVDKIKFLNQTLKELKDNHKLGADTIAEISDKYPDLLSHMGSEVDMSNAIKNAITSETDTAKKSMQDKIMYDDTFFKTSQVMHSTYFKTLDSMYTTYYKQLGGKYDVDLSNFRNLAEAKGAIENQLIATLGKNWAMYYQKASDGSMSVTDSVIRGAMHGGQSSAEAQAMIDKANQYNSDLKKMENAFNNITLKPINISTDFKSVGVGNSSPKKSSSTADKPDKQDATDAWIKTKQIWEERNQAYEKTFEQNIELAKSENKYGEAITQTNKLIEERNDRIKNLQWANSQIQKEMKKYNSSWVDSNGDETLSYVNAYNKASKKSQEAMKEQFDKLSKLKKQWKDNTDAVTEEKDAINTLKQDLKQLVEEQLGQSLDSTIKKMDDTFGVMDDKLKDIERSFSKLNKDDSTASQVTLWKQKLDLLIQEKNIAQQNVDKLKAYNTTLAGHTDLIAKNNEEIKKWEDSIKDLDVTIVEGQQSVKDLYNQLADSIIEQYKNALERQRNDELKAIQKTEDAEKERHDARMKNLDDEMTKYQKSIQQQLDAIDKQEGANNYDSELHQKQVDRQKILDKINQYSMDNTAEGRKQLADLKQQLADKEDEIEKFSHDRQIELRKDALNQELQAKQSQVDDLKTQEDNLDASRLADYQKERDELNAHYDNLVADDKKWNQIRKDVMDENFANIESDLQGFADAVNANAVDMGQNIADNITTEIQKAIDLMNQLKQDSLMPSNYNSSSYSPTSTPTSVTSSSSTSKTPTPTPTPAPTTPTPTPTPTPAPSNGGISASSLPLRKKSDGFPTPSGGWDKYSLIDYLKSKKYYADFSDREKLYKALFGGSYSGTTTQNNSLLAKLKTVQGLKTGGYTGDWGSSGKLAILHEKELVLNQLDTSNILKAVELVRNIHKAIPLLQPTNIKVPDNQPKEIKQGDINVQIDIAKLEGGEQGAKTLVAKLTDTLKRKGLK